MKATTNDLARKRKVPIGVNKLAKPHQNCDLERNKARLVAISTNGHIVPRVQKLSGEKLGTTSRNKHIPTDLPSKVSAIIQVHFRELRKGLNRERKVPFSVNKPAKLYQNVELKRNKARLSPIATNSHVVPRIQELSGDKPRHCRHRQQAYRQGPAQ